jgi:integrase/recombinase XerD
VRERLVATNPAADLELPRKGIRLPAAVLTAAEAEQILAVPDVRTPLGLRDRAILETFYSTGIRRFELAGLHVGDLDLAAGVLAVRQGKGKKDRFVPIGDRAAAWVAAYLREVRPLLAMHQDEGVLFLSSDGLPIPPETLSTLLNRIVRAAGIGKPGACHIFRHTMATLMLEGGADIRYIQQMLGHANLDTTQIYTHVAIHTLKAVHAATHPGASLRLRHEAASDTAATTPPHHHLAILLDEDEPESEALPN